MNETHDTDNDSSYEGKRRQSEEKPKRNRKKWLILLILLLVGAIGIGGYLYLDKKPEGPNLTVKKLPDITDDGLTINLENTKEKNGAFCTTPYDGSAVVAQEASKKFDGTPCVETPVLVIPIVGPCPIDSNGGIGAPSDWTKGCYHKYETGGLSFMGHSIRGPRVGAMERINYLKPGDLVQVGDDRYRVAKVSFYPVERVPTRIAEKNHFSLITCYLDAAADAGGPTTTNTVVELTDQV